MTLFVGLINILVLAFLADKARRRLAPASSKFFFLALNVRLAAGILLGLFYLIYYGGSGDTFNFFNNANVLTSHFFVDPAIYFEQLFSSEVSGIVTVEPRSLFFIKIVSFVNIFTFSNYFITSLWFSFFVFICSFRLVVKLDETFPLLNTASRIVFLFFPSVIFWSSGVIKESLAFGAVEILALYFITFMYGGKVTSKSVIEIALSLILLLSLKYYWAAVLLPSMATAWIIKKIHPKRFVAAWYLGAFVLVCLAVSVTHPNLYLSRFLSVIVDNNRSYVTGDVVHYYNLSPSWGNIVINSPWALVSGLFRPLIFEVYSLPGILASIENLAILGLFIWKIKYIRMPVQENQLIVLAVITYVVVLCVFLAISTPNLGTLSRYRVGFLSFFVFMILADHPILNFINGKPSNHIRS